MKLKINLLLLGTIIFTSIMAQDDNGGGRLNFGFNAGLTYEELKFERETFDQGINQLKEVYIDNSKGMKAGFLMNLRLTRSINIRPQAMIGHFQYDMIFEWDNNDVEDFTQKITNVEFPIHLNVHPFITKVPYFIVGPNFKYQVGSNGKMDFNQKDVGFDLGFGLCLNLKLFRLEPEIRYSFGLKDINKTGLNPYNISLSQVQRSGASIVINIVGN